MIDKEKTVIQMNKYIGSWSQKELQKNNWKKEPLMAKIRGQRSDGSRGRTEEGGE